MQEELRVEDGWRRIGHFSVDAGICWIGDPCYILHTDDGQPEDIGQNWIGFCDKMREGCKPGMCLDHRQFKHNKGHDGLGVCVATGHGDGTYDVDARIEDKIVKEIRIKFAD